MNVKKGSRVKYDAAIYEVVAVVLSTVYLAAVNDENLHYDYDISEIYQKYRDIEFLNLFERRLNGRFREAIKEARR